MAPIDRSHASSYSRSIVAVVLSCIISEIKQDIGEKSRFMQARPMPSCGVCLCVCHVRTFCQNEKKHIFKIFSPSGSHTILVQYGNIPTGTH